jgi:beta-aspartyl-peptidase (threonine type)
MNEKIVLVIHGGAGAIVRENLNERKEAAYRAKLTESLRAGFAILQQNGDALDAVIAAVQVMEDSLLFNAGRGAVYDNQERQTLDASLQRGSDRAAGCVTGVMTCRNPIAVCRLVMERSPHVLLSGSGADEFAALHGARIEAPQYFASTVRLNQVRRIKAFELNNGGDQVAELDHNSTARAQSALEFGADEEELLEDRKFGTVGACALDSKGELAAGTSTGGMANKRYGRVGDSPIIGAGTFASNVCAVSSTGHGEHFIRNVCAYDVAAIMQYTGASVQQAAQRVIDKLPPSTGGVIALSPDGQCATVFNTSGMYRGTISETGNVKIDIF